MLRPTTASTSTTSDSPPPQSPVTPPPYERLPPFFKVQIVEDDDVRMDDCSPLSHSLSLPKRPLSASHNDFQLPKLNLNRTQSLPAPPSGHDLMHLFPFQPSRVVDLPRNTRTGATNSHHHNIVTKPGYINTSTYFGKEEREYFRFVGSITGRDLEMRLEREREKGLSKSRGNEVSKDDAVEPERIQSTSTTTIRTHPPVLVEPPVKRRKSIDSGKADSGPTQPSASLPPPPLALGNVRQRVYSSSSSSPPQQLSKPAQSRSPSHSPSFQVRVQSTICPNTPNPSTPAPAPRRRAGKYTKRVFVHPNPLPNVNPPYLLANVYPPSPNDMKPTINVYPLANPLPQKTSVPYPPNSPPHSVFPQTSHASQFIEFAR